jgi:hypothetical protein
MVSALRCRFGNDNFLSDYNRFVRQNNDVLASQHNIIKARYASALARLADEIVGVPRQAAHNCSVAIASRR